MLDKLNVVYIHIAEVDWDDAPDIPIVFKEKMRNVYKGVLIYAGCYNVAKAEVIIQSGLADMIGLGRPFVVNHDLSSRIKNGFPLETHDPDTLFGGFTKRLSDYPKYKN